MRERERERGKARERKREREGSNIRRSAIAKVGCNVAKPPILALGNADGNREDYRVQHGVKLQIAVGDHCPVVLDDRAVGLEVGRVLGTV